MPPKPGDGARNSSATAPPGRQSSKTTSPRCAGTCKACATRSIDSRPIRRRSSSLHDSPRNICSGNYRVRAVDVSLVTYRPDFELLAKLLASIVEQAHGLIVNLLLFDNSVDAAIARRIAALPALQPGGAFAHVDIRLSPTNVGFGRGHNANALRGTAPLFLVI